MKAAHIFAENKAGTGKAAAAAAAASGGGGRGGEAAAAAAAAAALAAPSGAELSSSSVSEPSELEAFLQRAQQLRKREKKGSAPLQSSQGSGAQ
jgi:cobalamin biosynthesis protein CbiD